MDDLSFVNLGGDEERFDGGWEIVDGEVDGSEVGYLSVAVVADVGESVGADVTSFGGIGIAKFPSWEGQGWVQGAMCRLSDDLDLVDVGVVDGGVEG